MTEQLQQRLGNFLSKTEPSNELFQLTHLHSIFYSYLDMPFSKSDLRDRPYELFYGAYESYLEFIASMPYWTTKMDNILVFLNTWKEPVQERTGRRIGFKPTVNIIKQLEKEFHAQNEPKSFNALMCLPFTRHLPEIKFERPLSSAVGVAVNSVPLTSSASIFTSGASMIGMPTSSAASLIGGFSSTASLSQFTRPTDQDAMPTARENGKVRELEGFVREIRSSGNFPLPVPTEKIFSLKRYIYIIAQNIFEESKDSQELARSLLRSYITKIEPCLDKNGQILSDAKDEVVKEINALVDIIIEAAKRERNTKQEAWIENKNKGSTHFYAHYMLVKYPFLISSDSSKQATQLEERAQKTKDIAAYFPTEKSSSAPSRPASPTGRGEFKSTAASVTDFSSQAAVKHLTLDNHRVLL